MKLRPSVCFWTISLLLMLILTKHPSVCFTVSSNQVLLLRAAQFHRRSSLKSCSYNRRATGTHSPLSDASIGSAAALKYLQRGRSKMLEKEWSRGVSAARRSATSTLRPAQEIPPLRTAMDTMLPYGRLVGVELPVEISDAVMRVAEAELMPEEVSYCLRLHPVLQAAFLGGRLAIRRALHDNGPNNEGKNDGSAGTSAVGDAKSNSGSACGAILHGVGGAPLLPKGLSASISHKRHIAVALVQQPGALGHLGVDIELPAVRRRADLRRRVLTPKECDELGRVSGLSEEDDVLLRFSMKEAVYKAAHPLLRRTLGFKDVEVRPRADGGCEVNTTTPGAWGDLTITAGWVRIPDVLGQPLLLTFCKAIEASQH